MSMLGDVITAVAAVRIVEGATKTRRASKPRKKAKRRPRK